LDWLRKELEEKDSMLELSWIQRELEMKDSDLKLAYERLHEAI